MSTVAPVVKRGSVRFIRWHSVSGCYIGLVKAGNRYDTILVVDKIPVRLVRVPISERAYYREIDDFNSGLRGFSRLMDRIEFTNRAKVFLTALKLKEISNDGTP